MIHRILALGAILACSAVQAESPHATGSAARGMGWTSVAATPAPAAPAAFTVSPAAPTAVMGAPGMLTREQVRADAIQAVQQGTTTRGEKGGMRY